MVVYRFLDWMERAPAEARADAVPPLVRTYLSPDLAEADRDLLDAALTLLLDDPAVDVRRALAETLAIHERAPRHLIIALAADLPQVAEPVLRRSPVLLDAELIEIVSGGGARLQAAIARRPWVSPEVAEAIAGAGEEEAVLALVRNLGADIDEAAFHVIAERFGAGHAMREALFARPDLPLAARQAMIASLGARLNAFVVEREWLPERRARTVVREACDKATVLLAATAEEEDLIVLVEHLRTTGQLTTALLIRSICQGNVRFLEAALARLAGLPARRVYAILVEGREGALKALFTKAGLPERSHPAFLAALEVGRELDFDGGVADRARFARRMIERILTRYQGFTPPDLDDLFAMLRRLAADAAREAARATIDEARRADVVHAAA